MPARIFKLRHFLVVLAFFIVGCEEKEFDPNDPAKSFGIAKEPFDDENFEIAVQRLGEFKSRFPYSKYAAEAELLIADSQFSLSHYTEAALAYEQFVKLHPKHAKADYASYRIGESYWEDSPEEIDREQDYTLKAIKEWEKLIAKMPASPYAKKAKAQVTLGKRRVAESILFVVRFYCKQGIYHACAYRAIELADEYSEFRDLHLEALQFASTALDQVALAKAKDPQSDKNIYFKSMTVDEIKAKASNLRRLRADYERELKAKAQH